ncbi:unnamed protein product [Dibothriocephalus latus]|uniref:Uncharacterized protein n=1 Tax=Dibothriocephalus latus TaxID=60516 RepID=A0A3P7LQM4_DIBLA|nr:unnamed protein product [Dibothriocephalus latus]
MNASDRDEVAQSIGPLAKAVFPRASGLCINGLAPSIASLRPSQSRATTSNLDIIRMIAYCNEACAGHPAIPDAVVTPELTPWQPDCGHPRVKTLSLYCPILLQNTLFLTIRLAHRLCTSPKAINGLEDRNT